MHSMRRHLPYRPALTLLPLAAMMMMGVGLMLSGTARADADITFKGTLIDLPPCEISSTTGGPIEVDFGLEVVTRKVDGVNYREKIPVTLDCTSAVNQKLQLTLTGEPGYDADLIKASLASGSDQELGIRLYNGTTPLTPGTPLSFTPSSIPVLWAVPEARNNTTLSGGEFTGKANLVVEYQ